MNSHRSKRRIGASLLEALIATVILLVSVAALSSQATVGARAANRARLQSLACTICESILAEQLAGQLAADRFGSTPAFRVSGFSDWMAQTRVESLDHTASIVDQSSDSRLQLVSVTAWQIGRNERLSKTTLSRVVHLSSSSSSRVANSFVKP